jgi:BirA family transcriptional regulator, biotin operon repressor / biotin---[acetyl-CoA-carboxylase] ligase
MLDIEAIRKDRPTNQFHYFPTVDSTMKVAARLVSEGAPHGSVVLADEQTAGIGRLGRQWHSEAGLGIYCSVVLRIALAPETVPVLNLLLGLATAGAIQRVTNLACDLRWPNDVLLGERKVAGILAQLVDGCVVAGVGINVNHSHLPDGLRTPATSLRIASGSMHSREKLVIALLEDLDNYIAALLSSGIEAIIREFSAASSYTLNRRVHLEEGGRVGTTAGLDSNGFLMVRFDDGRLERVATGGVRPLRSGRDE